MNIVRAWFVNFVGQPSVLRMLTAEIKETEMNPYFVLLLWFQILSSWFDLAFIVRGFFRLTKNVRLILSLFIPEPKGTVDHLRGNVLRVNYVDPKGIQSKGYYLLSYSNPPLRWTKVRAITHEEYQRVEDQYLASQSSASSDSTVDQKKDGIEIEKKEEKERTVEDDLADIEAIITPRKFNFRDYQHFDVTNDILAIAGPGKDFFGSRITVHDINRNWHTMIISYGKGLKLFHSKDVIKF